MTATTFIGHFLGPDTHSNRPAAAGLPDGTLYVCTTHAKIERVVSGAWVDYATLGSTGGMIYRGAWNLGTSYSTGDVVTSGGALYIANTASGPTTPHNPLLTGAANAATFGSAAFTVPSTTQVGDLLIASMQVSGGTITPPSGWTLLTSVTTNAKLYIYTKTAVAGDIGATATFSNAGQWCQGRLLTYTTGGVDTTATANTATGPLAPPVVTSTTANETIVTIFGTEGGALTLAAGGTNQYMSGSAGTEYLASEDFALTSSGSTSTGGNQTATGATVGAVSILLKPYFLTTPSTPTYDGGATVSSVSGTSGSITIPSTTKVGDTILLAVMSDGVNVPTPPTGFTLVKASTVAAAGSYTGTGIHVFQKTAVALDIGASVTVSNIHGSWPWMLNVRSYTCGGVDLSANAANNGTTQAVPALTSSAANQTHVAFLTDLHQASSDNTSLASGGGNVVGGINSAGAYQYSISEDFALATAGSSVTNGGITNTTQTSPSFAAVSVTLKGSASLNPAQWDLLSAS